MKQLIVRNVDDETVRAIGDEVRCEGAKPLDVQRSVCLEGRDDRGQNLPEHVAIVRDGKAGAR